MANFEYSEKSWSKLKPLTLKKTGLGEALKDYEKKREALKSAKNLDFAEIMKALSVCDDTFEKVESARKGAVVLCGKSHAECEKALSAAKPAAEKKTYEGHALTALNARVIEGVQGFTKFSKGVDRVDGLKKAEQFMKNTVEKFEALDDEKLWSIRGSVLHDFFEKLTRTYGDEGDGKNNNAYGAMGGSFPLMITKRSILKTRFPTVHADVEKLGTVIENFVEAESKYATACQLIMSKSKSIELRLQKMVKEKGTK